ncbi:TetR family transcriptional regulator [Asanoa ishikariensis]|uniref:Transcriptional regulator, TetR family n=1 Tax=Asanoa ishikariensis TaxID=137265 RepID=A0A1H3TEG5_9ACTN|nr:TetR/AcrR family transcriptional regulator [Asanoa ishikariensis]GIF62580.1 TetR family transcriptional regulator [Asanoa ishikariensis]SDZ48626.1 transcriptional regulator, TetR family [Asanoa ishikariensis]
MRAAAQASAPRKDQVRNRQRLVEAAVAVFRERGGPDVKLDEVAHRAGMAVSSLYRHFPSKDDLIEAALTEMMRPAQEAADRAALLPDPREAFRTMFTESCTMPEAEGNTFNALAYASGRTVTHALSLLENVVAPATTRLRAAGGLREGLTVDDVATFLRMAKVTDTPEQRAVALDVLLAGMLSTP